MSGGFKESATCAGWRPLAAYCLLLILSSTRTAAQPQPTALNGCGGDYTAPTGTFTSPGFPAMYKSSGSQCTRQRYGRRCPHSFCVSHCIWKISTADYKNIHLVWSDFRFPFERDCCPNHIEVYDGPREEQQNRLFTMCGEGRPTPVKSGGNSLYIKMAATSSTTGVIFSATWTTACATRLLTSPSGTVESPGYPDPLTEDVECKWIISVEPGHVIDFTFDVFKVGIDAKVSCSADGVPAYVELMDGEVHAATKRIGRYCNRNDKPATVTTTGSHLTVVFLMNNPSGNVNGSPDHVFQASYTSRKSNDPTQEQRDLFPYGPYSHNLKLEKSVSERIDLGVKDKDGIPVPGGIPIGNQRVNRAVVHDDGQVSFYKAGETTRYHYIRVYGADLSYDAASDAGVRYNDKVSCSEPDNKGICDKANEDVRLYKPDGNFEASVLLVASWYKAGDKTSTHRGVATFQVAIASDFDNTYAVVYYEKGEMGWTESNSPFTDINIGIGIFSNGDTRYKPMEYSKTKEACFLDILKGNTGRKGTYFYELGTEPPSAERDCRDWQARNRNRAAERKQGFDRLPSCPCGERWIREIGGWVATPADERPGGTCYRLSMMGSRNLLPYSKLCCYRSGSFITNAPDAGSCTAYNPAFTYMYADYLQEDKLAYQACCKDSSSDGLCEAFYALRPTGDCASETFYSAETQRPPPRRRRSTTSGDPHIITFDEKDYVFNGWGEYTMMTLNTPDVNFTLQGRTDLAETESGQLCNATVFAAFGAEENGVRMFVGLDPGNKSSLIIYANGTDYSFQFQNNTDFLVDTEDFQLARDINVLYASFPSGISIGVSVRIKSLAVSVSLPFAFQGQTLGLLGNNNGKKEDDLVLPDGTMLPNNLTERQIFEQFGKKWQVSQSDSVMRYGPREGPANYTHPDFMPIFLDEQPADVRKGAEAVCGPSNFPCIYDYFATGSSAFALDSKQVKDKADETNVLIRNTVPRIEVPRIVNVTSGIEETFSLQGHDDDNDEITYHVEEDGTGAVQIDSITGLVRFVPDALQPFVARFFVKDSHNVPSPALSPIIIICSGCSGHGSCDYSRYSFTDRGNYNFQFAACVCEPAWDGLDCEKDRDGCIGNPCLEQQTCTDLTPDRQGRSSVGYDCGPCPEGYRTDPVSQNCVDVDECSMDKCEMVCFNTAGTYACSCNAGYRLDNNGHTCWDINECREKTDNCEQICTNTLGSYECQCEEGYTLDSSGTKCLQDKETASVCRNAGCSQGCKKSSDGIASQCFCRPGYDLDLTDNKTCVDHDECLDGICSQQCYNFVGGFGCYCNHGYQISDDRRTCVPCPPLRYGSDCELTCRCEGRGTGCHPVTGCVCEDGWSGAHCEDDVDECSRIPSVCGDSQLCINTKGSYVCRCPDGYTLTSEGTACTDIDECGEDSLLSTCGSLERCVNVPGTFYCECLRGFRRTDNECTDIDECASSKNDCEQICVNVPGTYNCECYYGYRLNIDRATCSLVSDVCAEQGLACTHGCTLSDVDDRAFCFCRTGYQLDTSDLQTCVDIDECSAGTSGCSHTCDNTDGGFLCSCPLGMKLDNDGKTCLECPTGTYGKACTGTCSCGLGSDRCDVTTGCTCKRGWQGDNCDIDVNECGSRAVQQECRDRNAICDNYPGGYRCLCEEGYKSDDDSLCQDIDECSTNVCDQQCENSPGSYRCLCNKGFTLNSRTGTCEDINECNLTATNNCTQRCVNTPGSYTCACNEKGYTLDHDGVTCTASVAASCRRNDCPTQNGGCSEEKCFCNNGYALTSDNKCLLTDVDWCAVAQCGQDCEETRDGKSFICSCRPGYLLQNDGTSCEECPVGRFGSDCHETCTCNMQNTESCNSSTGACKCKAGWEGSTCSDDIDECAATSGVTCPDNSLCTNTRGSYYCACVTGHFMGPSATDRVDCSQCPENTFGQDCRENCACITQNTVSCHHVTGACSCKAGWEGSTCSDDIDECAATSGVTCPDNSRCVNTEGSYSCICEEGYTRDSSERCGRQKTVKVSFILEGVIVEQADLSDTNSESYSLWSRSATQALDRWLRPKVRGFVSVTILALRVGSLVIDTEIVVDETNSDAVPTLSLALLDLAGDSLAVNNQMGNVKVAINDVDVDSSWTSCDMYKTIRPCSETEECVSTGQLPECRTVDIPSTSEDNTLTIVLAIVISLIVIIAIIVIVLYILKRRKKKSATITDTCEEDPGAKSGKGASDNDNLTDIATEEHNALLSTMPDPPRQSSGNIPGQFPNPLYGASQHPPEKLDSSEASPADRPHSASSNVSATGGTDGRDTTVIQATGENTTSAIGTDQKSETDP